MVAPCVDASVVGSELSGHAENKTWLLYGSHFDVDLPMLHIVKGPLG
jgi:hypothetical protein